MLMSAMFCFVSMSWHGVGCDMLRLNKVRNNNLAGKVKHLLNKAIINMFG